MAPPVTEGDEEERVGLLQPVNDEANTSSEGSSSGSAREEAAPPALIATQPSDAKPLKSQLSGSASLQQPDTGICRICLEEDSLSALEAPCKCSGTQRYAHHACIQRWVDEKGNARCEICEQPYGPPGRYTVPPAPLPMHLDNMPLFTPMYILDTPDGRGGHRHTLDLLESDQVLHRQSSVSWCITFIVFFMFLVVLHHTLLVADGMDGYDPSMSPGMSPAPSVPSPQEDPDSVASSLLLFLFWVATKAFLIGIPLYTVMKVASRQARREQYEAMMRAGAAYNNQGRVVIRVRGAEPPVATAV